MVHSMAERVTSSMIEREILYEGGREEYVYALETMTEKIITYIVLFSMAAYMHNILPTMTFMVFFFSLRSRTGGFHAKSFLGCLLGTSLIYIVMSVGVFPYFIKNETIMYVLLIISACTIFVIGNVNHPNLALNSNEVQGCKKSARVIIVIEFVCILCGCILKMNTACIFFAAMGVIMCAILLCIAILFKQEV